ITYFGHSCFLFDFDGIKVLLDPFISGNPLAADIDIDAIKAEHILITHGHGDHVADVERVAKNNNAKILSNFEIVEWFGSKGLSGHPMNHGGAVELNFGMVKYVPAVHSSVLPDGTYGGNPGGFVVMRDDVKFYIAGDTSLTMDMKLIPMLCGKLDFAILPVGGNFTMDWSEAVHAAEFIQCKDIIGCHFDTFPPIEIDHTAVIKAFADRGLSLKLPALGEVMQR
ncbi:MAG: metal-dependent hydrolase, partial [Saprospiraceae bacterium]|nr:metal-dependent hydrolase [Saprospiraceae bacterium]